MIAGFSWNFSIYIKKGPGTNAPNKVALSNSYGGVATDTILVTYDMGTGNSQLIQTGGFLNTGCTMSSVGNGWWRCFMWGTSTGQYWQRPDVVRLIDDGNNNRLYNAYVGNTQSNIYIWGMQLTQGTASRTYAKSSASISGDGYITKWYDQSGNNRHATQTTAASQPKIVSGGSIIKINSKPAAYFNGSNEIGVTYSTSKALNLYFLTTTTDTQYLYPWTTLSTYGFVAQSGNGSAPHSGYGSAVLYTNFNLRDSGAVVAFGVTDTFNLTHHVLSNSSV
jgi:hypothetical protein